MSVYDELLKTLALAGNEYISGAQLAERLHVSRNAVWKAVQKLENDGFIIDSVTGKGYRISSETNKLCSEIITAAPYPELKKCKIHIFPELESTNITAKKLASEGAPEGTVVIAEQQSSGKGRLGRSFFSPPEIGLYVSVILRPDFSADITQLITSCVACAVAETVEKLSGSRCGIKWVNDIYMNGKKICGILTEASFSLETQTPDYVVVGTGINVRSVKNIFPDELLDTVTSIEDETGISISRNTLCAEFIHRLFSRIKTIRSRDFIDFYRERELLTGHYITAFVNGEKVTAKAVGIDNNTELIVELADGTRSVIRSGEANLCRRID